MLDTREAIYYINDGVALGLLIYAWGKKPDVDDIAGFFGFGYRARAYERISTIGRCKGYRQ